MSTVLTLTLLSPPIILLDSREQTIVMYMADAPKLTSPGGHPRGKIALSLNSHFSARMPGISDSRQFLWEGTRHEPCITWLFFYLSDGVERLNVFPPLSSGGGRVVARDAWFGRELAQKETICFRKRLQQHFSATHLFPPSRLSRLRVLTCDAPIRYDARLTLVVSARSLLILKLLQR